MEFLKLSIDTSLIFLFRLLKWISLQLNNFGSTRFIDIGIWCQSRQRFFYCFAVKQKSMQLNHVSCNSSRKLCFLHLYWRAIISHHQPRPIPLQLSSSQFVELSNIILQVFCNWCCPEDIKWRRGSSLYAHSFFSRTPIPAHPSIYSVVRSTYYMKLKMSNISYGNVWQTF